MNVHKHLDMLGMREKYMKELDEIRQGFEKDDDEYGFSIVENIAKSASVNLYIEKENAFITFITTPYPEDLFSKYPFDSFKQVESDDESLIFTIDFVDVIKKGALEHTNREGEIDVGIKTALLRASEEIMNFVKALPEKGS